MQLALKPNTRVEVPGSHGVHITLTYTIISTPSLYFYLSKTDTRDKALKDIVALAQSDQLLKHLSSPELATLLVKMLFSYVKQRKMTETLSELINSAWLAILSKIRFLGRVTEVYPNLDTYIWKQLHKDDGKNDARYALPFMILKTLTTLPGGENTLPTVVAEFTRIANALHSNPDSPANILKTLPFIAQLVAFYDHKYVPFIVKKTDFLESCYKILLFAKNSSIQLDDVGEGESSTHVEFGHNILDPILSLMRFLGSEYRQAMIDKEIFEPIKAISSSSSDSKSQMAALKTLEQFNIELAATESLAAILADSASKETNPYLKHKAMQMVDDLIKIEANKLDEKSKLKVTATAFNALECDFKPTATLASQILKKLNPSVEILIEVGLFESLVDLLKRIKESPKPGHEVEARAEQFQYISGIIVDSVASQCVETVKPMSTGTPAVLKHSPLSMPTLREKILQVNLYGILADMAPLFWQYASLLPYLPFWLALGRIEPAFAEPSRQLFDAFLDYAATLFGVAEPRSSPGVKPDVVVLVAFYLLDDVLAEAKSRVAEVEAAKSLVYFPNGSTAVQCQYREAMAQSLYEKPQISDKWARLNTMLKDPWTRSLLSTDTLHALFSDAVYTSKARDYQTITTVQALAIRSMLPLSCDAKVCEYVISLISIPDVQTVYTAGLLVRSFVRSMIHHQTLFGLLHTITQQFPVEFFWIPYKKFRPILAVDDTFDSIGPVPFNKDVYRNHATAEATPPEALYSPYALSHFLNHLLVVSYRWLDASFLQNTAKLQKRLDISEFLTAYARTALVSTPQNGASSESPSSEKSESALSKAFSESGQLYTLDVTHLTRTLFNLICDYLYFFLQGKGGSIIAKAQQVGNRTVWFTDPAIVSFLMTTSSSHPRIVSMIASISSLGLDAVCDEVNASKPASGKSASRTANIKSEALNKCIDLMKSVMNSPASRLNALEAALSGMLMQNYAVEPALISSFARQLASLWPSIRDHYVEKRAMNGKLVWPWRLTVLANYALVHSDVTWRFGVRHHVQNCLGSDHPDSYLVSHMITFGNLEENFTSSMMETFKAHQSDPRLLQYAFSTSNTAIAPPRGMTRPTSYLPWDWFDRMETFRSLQTVIIDCLGLIPMDTLLPLTVEGEHIDTEQLARLRALGWPEVEEWNHPPKEGESTPIVTPSAQAILAAQPTLTTVNANDMELFVKKSNLCFLTATFVTAIIHYAFMPAAGYPCPSISKPALTWLIDNFWSRLLHEKEDTKHTLIARNLTVPITSPSHVNAVGARIVTPLHFYFHCRHNLPKTIHGYFLVHGNDPPMMLKLWRLIADRVSTNETNAALLNPLQDAVLQTAANGFITRYIDQLSLIVANPEKWERTRVTKTERMKTPVLCTSISYIRSHEDITANSNEPSFKLPTPASNDDQQVPSDETSPTDPSAPKSRLKVKKMLKVKVSKKKKQRRYSNSSSSSASDGDDGIPAPPPPPSVSSRLSPADEAIADLRHGAPEQRSSRAISAATMSSAPSDETVSSSLSPATDDPNFQRYATTGIWSDLDELDWYCAPVQVKMVPNKSRRFSPLDIDAFSAREHLALLPRGDYVETRPFIGIDIPKDATPEEKAEIYFKALSEPITEAIHYLTTAVDAGSQVSVYPGFLCNRWTLPSLEAWPASVASVTTTAGISQHIGMLRRFYTLPYVLYAPTLAFKHITEWFIKEEQAKAREAAKTPDSLNLPSAISLSPPAKVPKTSSNKIPSRERKYVYQVDASSEESISSVSSVSSAESGTLSSSESGSLSESTEDYLLSKRMARRVSYDMSRKTNIYNETFVEDVQDGGKEPFSAEDTMAKLDAMLDDLSENTSTEQPTTVAKEEEVDEWTDPAANDDAKVEKEEETAEKVEEAPAIPLDVLSSASAITFAWSILHSLCTLHSLPMSLQTSSGSLLKKLLDIEAKNGEPRLLARDAFYDSFIVPSLSAFAQFLPQMPDFKPAADIYNGASDSISSATQSSAPGLDGTTDGEKRGKSKKKSKKSDSSSTSGWIDIPDELLSETEKRIRIIVDRIVQDLHTTVDDLRTYRKFEREKPDASIAGRGFFTYLSQFHERLDNYKKTKQAYENLRSKLGSMIELHRAFPKAFKARWLLLPPEIITYPNNDKFYAAVRKSEMSEDDKNASILQRLALLDFGDAISPIATFNRPGICYSEEQATHAQLQILVTQLANPQNIRLLLSDPIWHSQLILFNGQMVTLRSILPFRALTLLAADGFFDEFANDGFSHKSASSDTPDRLTFSMYRAAIPAALQQSNLTAHSRGLAANGWLAMISNNAYRDSNSLTVNYSTVSDLLQGFCLDVYNDGAGILRFQTNSAYGGNWHTIRTWVELGMTPSMAEFGPNGEPIVDPKRGSKTIPRFVGRGTLGSVQVCSKPDLFVGIPPEFLPHHSLQVNSAGLKQAWQHFSTQSNAAGMSHSVEIPLTILAMRLYTGRAKNGDFNPLKDDMLKLANSLELAWKLSSTYFPLNNVSTLPCYNPEKVYQSSGGPVWYNFAPQLKSTWLKANSLEDDLKASSSSNMPVKAAQIMSPNAAQSSSTISLSTVLSAPVQYAPHELIPPPFPAGGIRPKKAISYLDSAGKGGANDGFQHIGVLPYNRVVNVWHENLGTSLVKDRNTVLRLDFQRKSICGNGDTAAQRFGFATQAAIEEINKHPLLQVGDVPGSFAYAPREHALYSEGRFISLTSQSMPTAISANFCSIMYDPTSKLIVFAGPVEMSSITITEKSVALRVPMDLEEELFPIISASTIIKYTLIRATEPPAPAGCTYPKL